MERSNKDIRIIARNRKARHDYHIEATVEAGLELRGSEVKSLREGKINLSDSYALVENGQVFLRNLHISPYKMAAEPLDPIRTRRLLLHKREIRKLAVRTLQRGMTLVPLSIYFKGPYAKVELGLGFGRKKHDKRQRIAQAEADKKMRRAVQRDLKR
ncbi:MAG: SsrA-binding protein SmpB [Candidatus Zixiibacteriota bacterium]|nr:MAG: SsrA-binding protein SmpB [candidate division Zixibacteria bacterium]